MQNEHIGGLVSTSEINNDVGEVKAKVTVNSYQEPRLG